MPGKVRITAFKFTDIQLQSVSFARNSVYRREFQIQLLGFTTHDSPVWYPVL